MHVLVVPSWYPRAEAPRAGIFFKEQAEGLQRAGLRVGVVVSEFRTMRRLNVGAVARNHFQCSTVVENGVTTLRRHGWALPLPRPSLWLRVNDTVGLIKKYVREHGRPDVLHAQSILHAGIAAYRVKRQMDVPYVVTEHSTAFVRGLIRPWEKEEIRRVVRGASEVMAVSHGLAAEIAGQYGLDAVRVVPNYVDTDFFRPCSGRRRAGGFRILSIGFLTPKKGMDVLLRAFAMAFPRDDSAVLEIGGDGRESARLKRLARELDVEERVTFLGSLSREEVRAAMWRADVFTLASSVETFGVVLIEALATGLPVVATRSGGPQDVVIPEVGILVNPNDVPALARGLKNARAATSYDPASMRSHVMANFSEETVTRTLQLVYEDAVTE